MSKLPVSPYVLSNLLLFTIDLLSIDHDYIVEKDKEMESFQSIGQLENVEPFISNSKTSNYSHDLGILLQHVNSR